MSFFETDIEEEKNDHFIWVEKYRPKKLEDYLGNPSLKEKAAKWIELQEIPHLLFHSRKPGTGKTTIAKLLTRGIKCDEMYINASKERKLDDIRNKVNSFAGSLGFNGLKICILDECLSEDTKVTVLRDGEYQRINISKLDDNTDLVKSYNFDTETVEWLPFTLMDKDIRETYEIEFENGETVVCTENHKWFVEIDGKIQRKTLSYIMEYNIEEIISPNVIT